MSDSNIPSKHKHDQQQQERSSFLQQIADFTPELLFVIDLDIREVICINKKAEQVLGHDANYVSDLGHDIFRNILHPDDYQRRMENLEVCKQLAYEKEAEVEVRMKIADGSWNWFRIRDKIFKRKPDGSVS